MTPGQLRDLRRGLPPFRGGDLPALLDEFCRYYGIDFAERNARLEYVAGKVGSGEFDLAVHYWSRPGATSNLLLLHGYLDHTGLFGKLIGWALAHGCNVLAFDLPGHGLSSGEPAVIDDFADYSRAIAEVLDAASLPPLPLWVMAQSTGGTALVDYAGKRDWPFAATVLLAPLVRPVGWRGIRVGYALLRHFTDSVPRQFAVNSSDRAFLEFLRADPLQSHRISLRWVGALRRWLRDLEQDDLGVGPALVIQGEADGTVDWRYNMGVIGKLFPDSRLRILPGAGHQLANEAEEFRNAYLGEVISWLAGRGITTGESSGIKTR